MDFTKFLKVIEKLLEIHVMEVLIINQYTFLVLIIILKNTLNIFFIYWDLHFYYFCAKIYHLIKLSNFIIIKDSYIKQQVKSFKIILCLKIKIKNS